MNRAERKRAKREQRIVGWTNHASPKAIKTGTGWFGEMDRVYRQGSDYLVMVRDVETEWGTVQHACMRNGEGTDIPWAEKQRIKNELFGEDRIAFEVFPETDKLVDEANMYHIWVLPKEFKVPFGLK